MILVHNWNVFTEIFLISMQSRGCGKIYFEMLFYWIDNFTNQQTSSFLPDVECQFPLKAMILKQTKA